MRKILIIISGLIFLFLFFISIPTFNNTECNILPHPFETRFGLPWKRTPCGYSGVIWGKSIIEYGSDLRCLVDKQGFCYLYGSCRPNACIPKAEYKEDPKIQQFKNDGCTSYFDGCNTCTIDLSTGHFMCTMIACMQMQQPKCHEYKK